MSSGSGGGTSTTTSSPPPQFLQAYQDVVNQATGVAAQPLQQYAGAEVAGFTPDQTTGMQEVENAQGIENPFINSASQEFGQATTPLWNETAQFSPNAVSQYESPYTSQVVQATENQMNNQNAIQQQGVVSNAVSSGAWGGDRSAVAQSVLAGQQQANEAPTIANLENTGYSQALGEFNTEQQNQLNANQANAWLDSQAGFGEASLGGQAQSEALTGASALESQGAQQQSLNQSELNIPEEQFMEEEAYPFQTTQYLANIAEGVGSQAGGDSSTTTTSGNSSSSAMGGILGAGALAAMILAKRGGGIARRAGGGNIPDVSISYVPNQTGQPMGGKGVPNSSPVPNQPQSGIGGSGLSFGDLSAISKMAKGMNLGSPGSFSGDIGGPDGVGMFGEGSSADLGGISTIDPASALSSGVGSDFGSLAGVDAIGEGSADLADLAPLAALRRGGGIANDNGSWREPMRRAAGGGSGGTGGGITSAVSPGPAFGASVAGGNGVMLPQLAAPPPPMTLNTNSTSNYTPPPVTSEPFVTINTLGSTGNPVVPTATATSPGTNLNAFNPSLFGPTGQLLYDPYKRGGGIAKRDMGGAMGSPMMRPGMGMMGGMRPPMAQGAPMSNGPVSGPPMGGSPGGPGGMPGFGMRPASMGQSLMRRRGGGIAKRDDGGPVDDGSALESQIADASPAQDTPMPAMPGMAPSSVSTDEAGSVAMPSDALKDDFATPQSAPAGLPADALASLSPAKAAQGLEAVESPSSGKGIASSPNRQAALMALAAAGFGMMAGRSTNAGQNIGVGALEGLRTYGNITSENQKQQLAQQEHQGTLDMEAKKLAAEVDFHKQSLAQQTKAEADRAEEAHQGTYTWKDAQQPDPNDPTKTVSGSMRYSNKANEPPQFFATGATPEGKQDWQILNDPANLDPNGNPTQYRYSLSNHQATTLTGEPYTPGGASAFAKAGAANAGTPAQQKQNFDKIAQSIASYQQPEGTMIARLSGPERQALMSKVLDLNPDYQVSRYNEVNKAMSAFGAGPQGNTARSADVAVQHLSILQNAVKALDNGDIPALNKVRNWWLSNTGSPLPTDVEAIKPIVSGEIAKAVMGSAGALQDREEIGAGLKTANSPAQLNGVIDRYKQLMTGQLGGLKQQYENSTGFDENSAFPFSKKLTNETQQQLHVGKYAPPPAEALAKIPEGKVVTYANGQKWGMVNGVLKRIGD